MISFLSFARHSLVIAGSAAQSSRWMSVRDRSAMYDG